MVHKRQTRVIRSDSDLTLNLPEGVNSFALVILNLPNPYATGMIFPAQPSAFGERRRFAGDRVLHL